jgi:iron complex outermembrane receptor protein
MGASAQYAIPFGGTGFTGRFSASTNYTSEMNSRAITDGSRNLYVGNSILIDRASFAVDAPERWSAMLYGDDINNANGAVQANTTTEWSSRVRPRMVGLQLDYHYK